jgi:hypothetical protein
LLGALPRVGSRFVAAFDGSDARPYGLRRTLTVLPPPERPTPALGWQVFKRAPAPQSACGLPGPDQQRRLGLPASQGLSLGLAEGIEDVEAQVEMYGEIAAVIERVEPEVEPTRIRLPIED